MFSIYFLIFSILFLSGTIDSTLKVNKIPVDTVDITGFTKCSLTTKWFKKQLAPFLEEFKTIPSRLNITYHPLSIGSKIVNGSKIAVCENGELECKLNKLQCCSKKYMNSSDPINLLKTLECIQGSNLETAIACLPEANSKNLIEKCSDTDEGEQLLISEPFPHNASIVLPWIKINGVRSFEATKNFKKVICELNSAKDAKPCLKI
ncbi:hypothetical protein GCK72_001771 [Caenorhabditis remanei]|uniref:DUF19 domain-containing protein n=1 Tax=Caenorhabditis remanei TaxID=31234 RepID=E3LLR5_CAERE|nr:hypothetical protein GCK72_001771 [Caenorhabditis remanei]EFP02733.1 hypothetical protein CRE_28250 [Caenorhabditis remanei]KAF1769954.1 hypothetical protein GCK72_001771 [Caenorhabditis remanei]